LYLTNASNYRADFEATSVCPGYDIENGNSSQPHAYKYVLLPASIAQNPTLQYDCRISIDSFATYLLSSINQNSYRIPKFNFLFDLVPTINVGTLFLSFAALMNTNSTVTNQYLDAIANGYGFALGGNPRNIVYTTGIHPNSVKYVLQTDSYIIGSNDGLPTAPGLTIEGPINVNDPFVQIAAGPGILTSLGINDPIDTSWPWFEYFTDAGIPFQDEYTPQDNLGYMSFNLGVYLALRSPSLVFNQILVAPPTPTTCSNSTGTGSSTVPGSTTAQQATTQKPSTKVVSGASNITIFSLLSLFIAIIFMV